MTDPYDDTGPPYPVPEPDNGIRGPWDVILSQYANSPIVTELIQRWFASVDEFPNLQSFFANIWDIDDASALNGYGANGYGLDVWGRIVGVNRVLKVQDHDYFGWNGLTSRGFNQAPFFSGVPATTNTVLDDETFLRLVMTKARANITNGAYQDLNLMLLTLFPSRGDAWVSDGADSEPNTFFGWNGVSSLGFNQAPFFGVDDPNFKPVNLFMTYNFAFALTYTDLAILTSGVMPKMTGVPAFVKFTGHT